MRRTGSRLSPGQRGTAGQRGSAAKYRLFSLLTSLLVSHSFAMDKIDEQRYTALIKEIRCVVCQNQSLADSNAPLAKDMRKKIYTMIASHQSDDDIKTYLTARYGEFILLNPRVSSLTIALWLFPFIGLVAGLWLVIRYHLQQRVCQSYQTPKK